MGFEDDTREFLVRILNTIAIVLVPAYCPSLLL